MQVDYNEIHSGNNNNNNNYANIARGQGSQKLNLNDTMVEEIR